MVRYSILFGECRGDNSIKMVIDACACEHVDSNTLVVNGAIVRIDEDVGHVTGVLKLDELDNGAGDDTNDDN